VLLELKNDIIYGPVNSRRLGRSLGVNVLPRHCKVCSFDCLYCQYGFKDPNAAAATPETQFPTAQEVARSLEAALAALSAPPAFITFSGNGEPTLHPRFPDVVQAVTRVRDTAAPSARTAILSNASTVSDPAVREALARLDERIMKLDAGTDAMLLTYNRPRGGLDLQRIVSGLAALGDVTVQALFTGGPLGNLTEEHVQAWTGRLLEVRPRRVQIYTLARTSPCQRLTQLSREDLLPVKAKLRAAGIRAEVF